MTKPTAPVAQPLPSAVQACPAGFDTRTIVVAFGVDHRPIDTRVVIADELYKRGLTSPSPAPTADGFTYNATKSHPTRYVVKYVYTKGDFARYLASADVHLIYCGHSRGGRGPCFLDQSSPKEQGGENWGDLGTFRMGFDFTGIPTSDITAHKYTPPLVPSTETIDRTKCEPVYLEPKYGSLASRTTVAPLPVGQYWGFMAPDPEPTSATPGPDLEWMVLRSGAADLGATTPTARVLSLFACNTAAQFKPFIAASGRTPSADSGFTYYTSGIASPTRTVIIWLYHLFTYTAPGGSTGCLPWQPSLDHALSATNTELGARLSVGADNGTAMFRGWSVLT